MYLTKSFVKVKLNLTMKMNKYNCTKFQSTEYNTIYKMCI